MNKNDQITGLFFLVITAILIGITFFLFILQKASAPVITNESIFEIPVARSTTTVVENVTIETPPVIDSIVKSVETSPDGVRREIRNEVLVKTWKHSSGVSVSLYEKDYFHGYFAEPLKETFLRMTLHDGSIKELLETGLKARVREVFFSPLGTYITVGLDGYESESFNTYSAKNGLQVWPYKYDYDSHNDRPIWSEDETKLITLRNAAGIDGTRAQIAYSQTGSFEDLQPLTIVNKNAFNEIRFFNIVTDNKQIKAGTSFYDYDAYGKRDNVQGTIIIDIENGTFVAEPEIKW